MNIKLFTIELIKMIRGKSPLIHNITNFVVMNSSANILLAIGASPVMAHCRSEVEEMTSIASALVLNIGTVQEEWTESMLCAAKAANSIGIPVILDPVGAGATKLRSETVERILKETRISVLRGNASEIFSLASSEVKTRGVDSSLLITSDHIDTAKEIANDYKCIIAISGEEDLITDGNRVLRIANGHPIMSRVTGTGCGLTTVTAAFCAVAGEKIFEATASAFAFYGICAEKAVMTSDNPGSFSVAFLDALYSIEDEDISTHINVSKG